MKKKINSENILVIGAGGLLGSSLVERLLKEEKNVIATDSNFARLEEVLSDTREKYNSNLLLKEIDINNKDSINDILYQGPNISGAVNCSYPRTNNFGKHFFDISISDFNEMLTINLGSAFLFMQQCADYFLSKDINFSLVNVSSIYGVINPKFDIYQGTDMTTPIEYSAIKSSLIHMTKYTAKYISDSRFRVNCISPGGILDKQPNNFVQAYKEKTLGTGMLNPEEVIGAIIFLLSKDSKFINGENIIIDDGFTL